MFRIPIVSSIFDMVGGALSPVQDLTDSIFGWNKPATAPIKTDDAPPPPPSPLDPAVQTKLQEAEAEQVKRSGRSRAATVLNTSRGLLKGPIYAKRSLMGI